MVSFNEIWYRVKHFFGGYLIHNFIHPDIYIRVLNIFRFFQPNMFALHETDPGKLTISNFDTNLLETSYIDIQYDNCMHNAVSTDNVDVVLHMLLQ